MLAARQLSARREEFPAVDSAVRARVHLGKDLSHAAEEHHKLQQVAEFALLDGLVAVGVGRPKRQLDDILMVQLRRLLQSFNADVDLVHIRLARTGADLVPESV